jgi:hypothetical protein
MLIRDPFLLGIIVCTGSGVTMLTCFVFLLDELLEPLGYSNWEIGVLGTVYMLSGTVSGVISSIIIEKYK